MNSTAIEEEIAWHKERINSIQSYDSHRESWQRTEIHKQTISRLEQLKQKIAKEKVDLLERVESEFDDCELADVDLIHIDTIAEIIDNIKSELTQPTQTDASQS